MFVKERSRVETKGERLSQLTFLFKDGRGGKRGSSRQADSLFLVGTLLYLGERRRKKSKREKAYLGIL